MVAKLPKPTNKPSRPKSNQFSVVKSSATSLENSPSLSSDQIFNIHDECATTSFQRIVRSELARERRRRQIVIAGLNEKDWLHAKWKITKLHRALGDPEVEDDTKLTQKIDQFSFRFFRQQKDDVARPLF